MKKSFKKITTLTIIGLLIFSSMGIVAPKKAYADLPVIDPGNIVQSTITAIATPITAAATYYQQLKSSVFDAIATAIAKQMMMQITMSVVKWINTGFKGSPAFVQNPGQFFQGIGDQTATNFLSNSNTGLMSNPNGTAVRTALAANVLGGSGVPGVSQYASSLSAIITKGGANTIQGASVNGFTGGDFRQGGWPAFLALTTVPANNPNGLYLQAQANLSKKVTNQQAKKQTQLTQGNGFLSWETCTTDPNAADEDDDDYSDDSGQTCTVQTPGSAISGALGKSLNVPVENLELANSMNDIINALFSRLVTTVLGSGLTSVSKLNSSGKSYLNQIADSATTQLQTKLQGLQSSITSSLAPAIKSETTITQNDAAALNIATIAQSTLTSASTCYTTIATAASSTPYPAAIAYAQGQVNQIQQILATTTVPISATDIANLTATYNSDEVNLQSFNNLSSIVSSAQDVNDLGTTSDEIQSLSESGNLPNAVDALNSTNSLTSTETKIAPIQADANSRLSACESFNPATYETGLGGTTGGL
jgi:hypothetical protein